MRNRRCSWISAAALPLLFLVCFAGSCDHTVLTGAIRGPGILSAGRPQAMTLEVPEELEGIHGEQWLVEPPEAGRFEPGQGQGRSVVFLPLRPGRATIRVFGFLRQTNPQPVTAKDILIRPAP